MKIAWLAAAGLVACFGRAAKADCAAEIAVAQQQAQTLPNSSGRVALMEQILRAENDRHEGDEDGCREDLSVAQEALRDVRKH